MDRDKLIEKYNNSLHRTGRITLVIGAILLLAVPFVVGAVNNVMPDAAGFASGILKVGLIYIPVGIVEFLVYAPMLGVGGSYLSFLTGNITNMKIPCIMNAKDIAGTEPGSVEHEIISTISIATSAITTMLVIVAGVICLVPLQPVLSNEVLAPAFNCVVPALFGALGLKYFIKNPEIAIVPLLFMSILCIAFPAIISQTSLMLIPCGALAMITGFILLKLKK